jgi:hypothetical protein
MNFLTLRGSVRSQAEASLRSRSQRRYAERRMVKALLISAGPTASAIARSVGCRRPVVRRRARRGRQNSASQGGDLGAGTDRGRAEHNSASVRGQPAPRKSGLAEQSVKLGEPDFDRLSKGWSAEVVEPSLAPQMRRRGAWDRPRDRDHSSTFLNASVAMYVCNAVNL